MKEQEQSMLDKIPTLFTDSILNFYYWNKWDNGMVGAISDSTNSGEYRFYKAKLDVSGNIVKPEDMNPQHYELVATGIIGYWLHYRPNEDRLATFDIKQEKTFENIFITYTDLKYKKYKDFQEKNDPSSHRRNLEREFYTEVILPIEEELNIQTKALFPFIRPSERQLIGAIMDEYMLFLKTRKESYDKEKDENMVSDSELRVLKYLETYDDSVLGDMPDYEFNVICDDLEKGGYIKVAWIEGHVPEAAELLDRGKLYLRRLEEGQNIVKKKAAARRKRTETKSSVNKKKGKRDETANDKPILELVIEGSYSQQRERLYKALLEDNFIDNMDVDDVKLLKLPKGALNNAKKEEKEQLLFNAALSNTANDVRIVWKGFQKELGYFIDKLHSRGKLKNHGGGIWQVTRAKFLIRKKYFIDDEHTGGKTKYTEVVEIPEGAFNSHNFGKSHPKLDSIISKLFPTIGEEINEDFNKFANKEADEENNAGEKLSNGYKETSHGSTYKRG